MPWNTPPREDASKHKFDTRISVFPVSLWSMICFRKFSRLSVYEIQSYTFFLKKRYFLKKNAVKEKKIVS